MLANYIKNSDSSGIKRINMNKVKKFWIKQSQAQLLQQFGEP